MTCADSFGAVVTDTLALRLPADHAEWVSTGADNVSSFPIKYSSKGQKMQYLIPKALAQLGMTVGFKVVCCSCARKSKPKTSSKRYFKLALRDPRLKITSFHALRHAGLGNVLFSFASSGCNGGCAGR